MQIKHWQGYGKVEAKRIKDNSCTLHVRVKGNHEWGLVRDDEYDLFNWLVKRFDKTIADAMEFHRKRPHIIYMTGYEDGIETCDYMFVY